MALRRLWRRLPLAWRARLWRGLDLLGARPVRLAAGPARGLTLLVPASRRAGYRAGRFERPVLELLADRLAPGMQFVDAGAYLGYFTVAAAALVGTAGHVWAFEPRSASRRLLDGSVRRNRLTNVTVDPRALGRRSGEGRLLGSPNPSMDRLAAAGADRAGTTPVAVITLDQWRAETGARPDVVKLDVEGAELDVLAGGERTLRRDRPLLVIEAHSAAGLPSSPRRLVDWLEAAGYGVRPLTAEPTVDLEAALDRLAHRSLAPGRVAVLHLLATPGRAG